MPLIVPVRLPVTALNQTVTEFLSNKTPGITLDQQQIVNTQLNVVLKSQLTASATNGAADRACETPGNIGSR
jgi:hypothetical protein